MGCACLFALLAAGAPRLALVLIWLFTNWIGRAFQGSFIVPLLGFLSAAHYSDLYPGQPRRPVPF
jgi:hypothetical protein